MQSVGLGRMWPSGHDQRVCTWKERCRFDTSSPAVFAEVMEVQSQTAFFLVPNLFLTSAELSAGISKGQGVLGWVTAELAPRHRTPF